MNLIILITVTKNILLGVLATIMIYSFTSSVTKVSFATTSVSPKARGYVKVTKEGSNEYAVSIHISDLTPVSGLQPFKKVYIVWMISDQYITKNLGQLNNISSTSLSVKKTLFQSVTSLKPSKIFITAENDIAIERPGVQVIMATYQF